MNNSLSYLCCSNSLSFLLICSATSNFYAFWLDYWFSIYLNACSWQTTPEKIKNMVCAQSVSASKHPWSSSHALSSKALLPPLLQGSAQTMVNLGLEQRSSPGWLFQKVRKFLIPRLCSLLRGAQSYRYEGVPTGQVWDNRTRIIPRWLRYLKL